MRGFYARVLLLQALQGSAGLMYTEKVFRKARRRQAKAGAAGGLRAPQTAAGRGVEKMDETCKALALRLRGLAVFRGLLKEPLVQQMQRLLEAGGWGQDERELASAWGAFASELFAKGPCWTDALLELVLQTENCCLAQSGRGKSLPNELRRCLESELGFLSELAGYTGDDLRKTLGKAGAFLPAWQVHEADFAADYARRMADIGHTGYGIFAQYRAFTVENTRLVPVKHPDGQSLAGLPGYEPERQRIITNTEALLAGRPAANVLLYGDAGTGKSSTVKAIANEYAAKGLRLVEVKKNQLYEIPGLMDALAENPLKFILFIDDLSFTANDDNFAALKAILEGSVGGRARNLAVYATSNRRHLIKETMSDREGDDIHHGDTMQELMSLAARFGLTVTFGRPDKERYLQIVQTLADQNGLAMPKEELAARAEAFAIRAGGRSPRAAQQLIGLLCAGVQM